MAEVTQSKSRFHVRRGGAAEIKKINYQRTSVGTFRSTLFTLIVVAAVAVLVAVLLLPVLRIYGHSMNDTLEEGEIVITPIL